MDCMRNHFRKDVVLDGRFKTVAPLNHGSFGMVFKARDMVTGDYVALKCVTKPSAANVCPSAVSIDARSEELAIHQRIGYHPNIVNLVHSFETEHHIYLVLEFCPNGDLYEAIRLGKGPLETEHVREFMLQLVDAVEHMHSKGLYHRDLKPENIFLTYNGSMKLGDFGLATTEKWSYESAVGSDRYMAPEQFDSAATGYSPAKADVWAIGICLLNVLFSRNPFAVPNDSDPLYRDFVADRQSLFDVFPNMSQDTFQILTQCLALEPGRRSLSGVREALTRVISFTTDDELLDEFCNASPDDITATANREPLRTPSISSPQVDQGGAFPWQKALAGFSQFPRQLSAIPDEVHSEDLFPESERSSGEWTNDKRDSASIVSFVDSGLGLSLKSSIDMPKTQSISASRARPVPISGSLPASAPRPIPAMSSVFSKKNDAVSKSWSDMFEEEEEENLFHSGPLLSKVRSRETVFSGRSTPRPVPRAGLSEVKNPATVNNSRDPSPAMRASADDRISEQTGFIFEDHHTPPTPRYTPPKRSMADMTDRWAALGNRRRRDEKIPEEKATDKLPKSKSQGRKRTRTGSWRRNNITGAWTQQHNDTNNHNMNGVWERGKDWSLSKDWRQHQSPLKKFSSSVQLRTGRSLARDENEDLGADIEWVGGWHDLHL